MQWGIIFAGLHGGGWCDLTVLCKEHSGVKGKAENKMSKNGNHSQGGADMRERRPEK